MHINDVSSKHYDRYEYLVEKREALKVWEHKLFNREFASSNLLKFRIERGR